MNADQRTKETEKEKNKEVRKNNGEKEENEK